MKADPEVVKMCESLFKGDICGDDYLRILREKIVREINHTVFQNLSEHDLTMKLLMKICIRLES